MTESNEKLGLPTKNVPVRDIERHWERDSIDEGRPDDDPVELVPSPLEQPAVSPRIEAYEAIMHRFLQAMKDETAAVYTKDLLDSFDTQNIYRHINGAAEAVKDAVRRMEMNG